jgi:FkbM family methyltransferase
MSNSSLYKFMRGGKSYRISLQGDIYGLKFWEDFANRKYEPDTQSLIEGFCREGSIFIDIGAAYGSMTLLAAGSGATVYAYEPNPSVFQGLEINTSLNEKLKKSIKLSNEAVSSNSGTLNFEKENLSEVLSPIVFTNWANKTSVEVVALRDIIQDLTTNSSKTSSIIIKMDIEGAEWKILKDLSTLKVLKSSKSIIILAIHPGLHRPPKSTSTSLGRLRFYLWNVRNLIDCWSFYNRLSRYCTIHRTNLNRVRRPLLFCFLVLGGNHEFVLNFGRAA